VVPLYSTRTLGLLVATGALPSGQASTSAGMASMREVGLDNGMITGRGVDAAIASITSRVEAPCTVEEPSRMADALAGRNAQLRAIFGVGLLEVAQFVPPLLRLRSPAAADPNLRRHGASCVVDAAQVCR
jgi:hypothetical protein